MITKRTKIQLVIFALITMIATFGTALDVTLSELALETFLPGDAETLATLHRYAERR